MEGMILYFKVKIYEWLEQRKVKRIFYQCERFKLLDLSLLKAYRRANPYRLCRRFTKAHSYGETPLTTMAYIAQQCALSPSDVVIEMGAGRGRVSLFLAEYLGCRVIAYEQVPPFVENMPSSPNLQICGQDMFSADFSVATAIYLYGTMLEDEEIERLCAKFPQGVKILTVSYPLSDYSPDYVIMKTLTGRFPWGKTEIYWNERIS